MAAKKAKKQSPARTSASNTSRKRASKKASTKRSSPGLLSRAKVVKVCVREIRHALGDEAVKPQFVETVGVQGYRFIFFSMPEFQLI